MSFVNGIFLFAAATAAVPILLHLVRRVKPRPVPFGSIMFLRSTPRELIRKRRLRDRLLMAARAAMLLLLAFAFARPYVPTERLPFVPQREAASIVLVVDRSLSMQYEGVFERAIQAVQSRLDALVPGDEVALVTFDDRAEVLSPLGTDHMAARAMLGSLQPTYRATDFLPALQQAADLLGDARHARRAVILVSDLQETAWEGSPAEWKLPPGVSFEVVSVADDAPANAYVEAFQHRTRRAGPLHLVRHDARVVASGGATLEEREVSFYLDDQERERMRLPGRSTSSVSFEYNVTRTGFMQGVLALDPDRLPADDHRYFTYVAESAPLVVAVDAPSRIGRRDAFYLRAAFDVGDAARFRFAHADRLSPAAVRDAQVLFLSVPSASPDLIRAFVERGGTAVLSPGESVDIPSFAGLLRALNVGTVREVVDARAEQGADAIIGNVETRHPIFEPFSGRSAVLLRPRFRRYVRLEPGDSTSVLSRFDTGDAFLAERTIGRGRILVYTSTFNTGWTDLPVDESYVPLVYQLAVHGSRRSDDGRGFIVGEVVALDGAPGATWEVRAPGGRHYRVTMDEDGRGLFSGTERPGQYAAAGEGLTRLFSVNIDPRESDLRARDPEEVYASVAVAVEANAMPQEAALVDNDERRQKLWRLLLLGVILLFTVETALAHRARTVSAATGGLESSRLQARNSAARTATSVK